jgi:hypothetical protein
MNGSFRQTRGLTLVAILVALVSCGCGGLKVSEEKVFIAFRPQLDEANLLLTYQDFYVDGDKSNLEAAQKQLDSLFKEKSAFMPLPPFLIDLSDAEDTRGDENGREILELLRKHIAVCDAGLVLNRERLLDGYQKVRIRDLKEFVGQLNALVSTMILKDSAAALFNKTNNDRDEDMESRRLLRKALMRKAGQAKPKWVSIEDGRVSFFVPATPASVRRLIRENMESFLRVAGDSEWSFSQRSDHFVLSLGNASATPIRLSISEKKPSKRTFEKELHTHAAKICPDLSKTPSIDEIASRFLAEPWKRK